MVDLVRLHTIPLNGTLILINITIIVFLAICLTVKGNKTKRNVFEVLFFVDEFHRFAIHNSNETIFETKQAERKTRLVLFFVSYFLDFNYLLDDFL